MKKVISSLLTSAILVLFSVPTVSAARQTAITYSIPGDTDIYLEFNPQENNPVNQFLRDLIDQNRADEDIFSEPGNVIAEKIINSEQVGIAFKLIPSEFYGTDLQGYIFIKNTQEGHDKFVESLKNANQAIDEYFADFETPIYSPAEPTNDTQPNEVTIGEANETPDTTITSPTPEPIEIEQTPEVEEYKNHTINNISDGAITFLDNSYTVISDNSDSIKALIDWKTSSNPESLGSNRTFSSAQIEFLPNSFGNFYMSGKVYEEIMTEANNITFEDNETLKLQAKMFDSISFSAEQSSDNNHNVVFQAQLNPETKEALGLDLEKYNFIPRFTRLFSHNDLILFSEEYNLTGQFTDSINLLENQVNDFESAFSLPLTSDEIDSAVQEFFGINLSDLKNLASEHVAFAIYDNNTVIPGMTAAFNVSNYNDEAERLTKTIKAWLIQNVPTQITETTTFIGGTKVPTLQFEGPFGEPMSVTVGITANNLIISTDNQLKEHYGNSGITGSYSEYDMVNSFAYLNPQNAANLLSMFLQREESIDPENADEIAKIALAPFGAINLTSTVKQNKIKTEGTMFLDPQKFLDYERMADLLFQNAFNSPDLGFTEIESPFPPGAEDFPTQFCDVANLADETQQAIKDLQYAGVIKGNPDGCYYPEKTINRAEFVTLIDRAFQLGETSTVNDFSDVPADAWFAESVNKAVGAGIIKGHPDGTFRPADPINLAEAAAILHRMTTPHLYISEEDAPYTDIEPGNWFYEDIVYGFKTGILPSATEIMPGKKINRAEAAEFIYRAY